MVNNINIDFKNLEIKYEEVLRYLGYSGQTINTELKNIIRECILLTNNKINPRYVLRIYPIHKKIEKDSKGNSKYIVKLMNTSLEIESRDIYKLLEGCSECLLMATTLGIEIEREIKKYSYSDLTKGIIIDSCATTAIEGVCDLVESKVREELLEQEKYITNRYSPGYGDLSININNEIINILRTQSNIGLTITDSNIMLPRKSVIAIMGISESNQITHKKSCLNCNNYNSCKYRKEVECCEH